VNQLAVGDGQGHFAPSHSVRQDAWLDAGDVDGDGAPELLSLETAEGTMRLHALRVDAQGALSSWGVTTSSTAWVYPFQFTRGSTLRVADFNGDGRRDFLFLQGESDSSTLCSQNADGTCTGQAIPQGYCQSAQDARDVDLDGDAVPELVFAVGPGCYHPGAVRLHRPRGATSSVVEFMVENPVSDVTFIDSDADGTKEVVVGANDVSVLGGNAAGGASHFDVGARVRALATGDFTGDGLADLAALNDRREVFLLVGQGGGRFERMPAPLATLPPRSIYWVARLHAIDFNRDGRDDLLVSGSLGVTLLTSSGTGFSPSKPFGETSESAAVGDGFL